MRPLIPLLAAATLAAPLHAFAQAAGSISIKFAPSPAPLSFPAGSLPVRPPQFVSPAAQGPGAVGSLAVPGAARAGISWQPFSVQGAGVARFAQPAASPAAAVVNRVPPDGVQQISGATQVHLRAPAATAFSDVQLDLKRPGGQISATAAMQTPEGRIVFRATPQ